MLNVRLAGDHLYGKLLFTWLSLVKSMIVSFCAVLFPMRCLGWDLRLNWVSFWGFFYLLLHLRLSEVINAISFTPFYSYRTQKQKMEISKCHPCFLYRHFWKNYLFARLKNKWACRLLQVTVIRWFVRLYKEMNIIYNQSSMQTEKFLSESKRIMHEKWFTEFQSLAVGLRNGNSSSA